MGAHPATVLRDPVTNLDVEIDNGLVDLISLLWQRGVRTVQCCEGDGQSRAYITFASPADYDCFMRAIFIIDGDEPTPEQLCAVNTLGGGWNVRLRSHATGATCADGTPELAHVPAVYFPHRHVATLAPRLRSSTARLGSGRAKRD